MAKHTPAPWKIGASLEIWHDSPDFLNRPICQILKRYKHLAGGQAFKPEDEANAHLIAAAPELLEALKSANACIDAMFKVLEDYKEDSDVMEESNEAMNKAQDAISKAEGEQS